MGGEELAHGKPEQQWNYFLIGPTLQVRHRVGRVTRLKDDGRAASRRKLQQPIPDTADLILDNVWKERQVVACKTFRSEPGQIVVKFTPELNEILQRPGKRIGTNLLKHSAREHRFGNELRRHRTVGPACAIDVRVDSPPLQFTRDGGVAGSIVAVREVELGIENVNTHDESGSAARRSYIGCAPTGLE